MDSIKLIVEVVRIKGENEKGKYDFLSTKAFDKRGKKCKIKFTKECANKPTKEGVYILYIEPSKINQDKSTKFYEFWVKDVISIEAYSREDNTNVEDLPF